MDETSESPPEACTFCCTPQDRVEKLIKGPDVSICDRCVEKFGSYLLASEDIESFLDSNPNSSCSFCGKLGTEAMLFFGDNATICIECVQLCLEIVHDTLRRPFNPDILLRVAEKKLRLSPAHRTYARLSIATSHEQEFVDKWLKQIAAALTVDGLVRITFVPGVTFEGRTGWHVVGEWPKLPSKLGDSIKLVIDRMQKAGVLLRNPDWHAAEGITYLGHDWPNLLLDTEAIERGFTE